MIVKILLAIALAGVMWLWGHVDGFRDGIAFQVSFFCSNEGAQ